MKSVKEPQRPDDGTAADADGYTPGGEHRTIAGNL
jgi:hypothetical protein